MVAEDPSYYDLIEIHLFSGASVEPIDLSTLLGVLVVLLQLISLEAFPAF